MQLRTESKKVAWDVAIGLDSGQSTQGLVDHVKGFVLYPKSNWFQTGISESDSVGLFGFFDSNTENRLKRDKSKGWKFTTIV